MAVKTPALKGATLYDNRSTLVSVYPELSDTVDAVHQTIERAGCKGCAQNKYTRKILTALIRIKYDGRDLSPLEAFMDRASIAQLTQDKLPTREPLEIPMDECPHCVQKHLCACFILMNEYVTGYDDHLEYARAHYAEAVREGYKGAHLDFDNMTMAKALGICKTLATHLNLDKDRMFLIGALAVLGEITDDGDVKDVLRRARVKQQPMKPPKDEKPVERELPRNVVIKCKLCPGDILMLTAAVRDLKLAMGNKMEIAVDSSAPTLWDNNPYIVRGVLKGGTAKVINAKYTSAIKGSNQRPHHFVSGYRQNLEEQLGIRIPAKGTTGCVFLTKEEIQWGAWLESQIGSPRPYWVIQAGGKSDVTNKWWPQEYWQEVVYRMKERIDIIQVGQRRGVGRLVHMQYELRGVTDLVNKTNHRQLMQLLYHSMGATCGVTYLMHLSAALSPLPATGLLKRPCVVIAGGREPAHWEMYQHHTFLHNCGMYDCNRQGGCWKARTVQLPDNNKKRNGSLCAKPVQMNDDMHARCLVDITPDMVVDAMERYLDTMRNPYA